MKKWFPFLLVFACVLYTHQALAQKQSHKDYKNMKLGECNECHKGEGVAPNHEADWVRLHRSMASKTGHNCADCHSLSFCKDCHFGGGISADLTVSNWQRDYIPKSHRSDFTQIHPIKALDNPQTCYRCHDKKFCNDCHSRYPRGSMRIRSHLPSGPNGQTYMLWGNEHATEARRNLQACQSCHPEGDVCLRCHSARGGAGINPHPKSFRGDAIKDRSDRACIKCHILR